jgi:hypothetical protein
VLKPRRPRPTFNQAKQSGATNIQSESSKTPVQRSPDQSGSEQLDRTQKNVLSESGAKEPEPEGMAETPQLEVMNQVQNAPELETPGELIQEKAEHTLSAASETSDMDTMEVPVERPTVQRLPESSTSEAPVSAFSEPITKFDETDVSEPAVPNVETMTSRPEQVFEEPQGADEFTSSEPITVVSRRIDPEQSETPDQPAQLSPEPGDEPTMIIERRPSIVKKGEESGTSESGLQSGTDSIGVAPQTQIGDTHPGFEQPFEEITSPQVTQPVQRIPEPSTGAKPNEPEVISGDEPGSGDVIYQGHRPPPLQEVWPVKLVPQQQEARQRESVPKAALQSVSSAPVLGGLQRKLASIPTARPSESSVAIMRPRLQRQIQRTAESQTQTQQPVTTKAAETGRPVAENQAEPPATVQTEIGELPADLWSLIRQKPPTSPANQPVTVQAKKDNSSAVVNDVVQKKVEPVPYFSQPPVIQRVEEQPPAAAPQTGAAEEGVGEGEEKGETEIDIDSLAQQVFSQIKRRLSVEWERGRGRHGREW